MLIDKFNHTIDIWIKALDQYDFNQLCTKPAPQSWSAGQLYQHLINETSYYIDQIRICIANSNHEKEEASPVAKAMLLQNDFPDMLIEGAPSNAQIPQPCKRRINE